MNLTEQAQKLKDELDECIRDSNKYCVCDDGIPCITHETLDLVKCEIRGFLLALQNEKDFLGDLEFGGNPNKSAIKSIGRLDDRLTEITNAIKLLEDIK